MTKYKYSTEELERMASNPWLTKREKAVFEGYFRDGLTIETVAANLDVCRRTVVNDLASIRRKSL